MDEHREQSWPFRARVVREVLSEVVANALRPILKDFRTVWVSCAAARTQLLNVALHRNPEQHPDATQVHRRLGGDGNLIV
jgi:hypothetical protein